MQKVYQLENKVNDLSTKKPERGINNHIPDFKKVREVEAISTISGFPIDDPPENKFNDYSTINRFQPDHSISQINGIRYFHQRNIIETNIPKI
mmetsp:Transcript_17478/g.26942  ORF Transcript_17478/g.26942 Transcript_17478/m.26942 type:complete len:93 (+) Transcript_17478:298-576(+)